VDGQYPQEPPASEIDLLELKLSYYGTLLENEEIEWKSFKASTYDSLRFHAKGLGSPPPLDSSADDLERGKKRIEKLRAKVAFIRARVDHVSGNKERREKLEHEQDEKRENYSVRRNELAKILL